MKTTTAIRCALTGALLIMVYRETGPWTAICLTLLAIANEVHAHMHRNDWRDDYRQYLRRAFRR